MQNELKPNRSGNYHHNGNPKHGLYRDNAALFNVIKISLIGQGRTHEKTKR